VNRSDFIHKYFFVMKLKIFLLFFLVHLFIFPNAVQAFVHLTPDRPSANAGHINGYPALSIDDLVHLNTKELRKKTGRKLKLRERIGLFILKKEIKRARKKGKTDTEIIQQLNEPRNTGKETAFFILGFLLGLLGILIALIASKSYARFAFYGFLARLGIIVLALFYALYNR